MNVSPVPPTVSRPRICFLDRDGVVIVEKNYLSDPDQVELIPGVSGALRELRKLGFRLAVVSNQSGVARGFFTETAVRAVNARMTEQLRSEGVELDAVVFCPHHPAGTESLYACECECRKPRAGMLTSLAEKWDADLLHSVMIGDKISDMEAGVNAGCLYSVMVMTGHGGYEAAQTAAADYPVFEDLAAAVRWLALQLGKVNGAELTEEMVKA